MSDRGGMGRDHGGCVGRRVGILTGGGDAPGLNAVIRAFTRRALFKLDWTVIGIEDSFDGLLDHPRRIRELDRDAVKGILALGGTILGTTNKGDPFAYHTDAGVQDVSGKVADAVRELPPKRRYEVVNALDDERLADVLQELPMEFAVEAQKLVAISLEGSVG